jgi:phosphoglycolate phosphatase-like HAD superfamily hydrolase
VSPNGPNRLAVVFDFDLTLSPCIMMDPVLKHWGLQPEDFWASCTALQQGPQPFDLEHSYLYRLVQEGRQDPARRLNAATLRQWGAEVPLYPGLVDEPGSPGLLRALKDAVPPGTLELFIISGGLQPLVDGCLASHGLADYFNAVFACRMAEEDPGDGGAARLGFPMETVGFTIKTQKLFSISKGSWKPGAPDVNSKVARGGLRVPFTNMLYLGDGHSDLAAFALLRQLNGTSIAVHHPGNAEAEAKARSYAVEQGRAHGWFEADYRAGSPLRTAILNWARQVSRGEQPQLALG